MSLMSWPGDLTGTSKSFFTRMSEKDHVLAFLYVRLITGVKNLKTSRTYKFQNGLIFDRTKLIACFNDKKIIENLNIEILNLRSSKHLWNELFDCSSLVVNFCRDYVRTFLSDWSILLLQFLLYRVSSMNHHQQHQDYLLKYKFFLILQ